MAMRSPSGPIRWASGPSIVRNFAPSRHSNAASPGLPYNKAMNSINNVTDNPTPPHASAEWPGAFASIKLGFEAISKNQQFALLYIGANAIGTSVSHWYPHRFIGEFIGLAVSLILIVAVTKYALATARGETRSVSQLFNASALAYVRVIGALLAFFILLILSAVGLFIPLIWIIPWASFILYAVIDKHTGVFEAFRVSKQLAQHHKGKIWALVGASWLYVIGATLLTFIPIVGWLATSVAAGAVSLAVGTATGRLYFFCHSDE